MKTILIGFAAAFVASASSSAPIRVNAEVPPAAHVRFADLNLASADGRTHLEERIRAAAGVVCGNDGDRSLDAYLRSRSCYDSAVASGLRQMDEAVQQQASASRSIHHREGE